MTELEAGGYRAVQHGFKLDTLFEQHGNRADFNIFSHDGTPTSRHPSRKLGFFFTESAEEGPA